MPLALGDSNFSLQTCHFCFALIPPRRVRVLLPYPGHEHPLAFAPSHTYVQSVARHNKSSLSSMTNYRGLKRLTRHFPLPFLKNFIGREPFEVREAP